MPPRPKMGSARFQGRHGRTESIRRGDNSAPRAHTIQFGVRDAMPAATQCGRVDGDGGLARAGSRVWCQCVAGSSTPGLGRPMCVIVIY